MSSQRESILVSEWKFSHNLGRKGETPMRLDTLKGRIGTVEKEAETVSTVVGWSTVSIDM